LKWKIIEDVFEKRKNDSRFIEENGKVLALGIFGLVLVPNLIGIISLEAATTFIKNKKNLDKPYCCNIVKNYLDVQPL
jgi:hypothetical protein